ncbi:hypothetical protein Tco_0614201, partial [Tanacetum coccineum]
FRPSVHRIRSSRTRSFSELAALKLVVSQNSQLQNSQFSELAVFRIRSSQNSQFSEFAVFQC